MFGLTTDVLRRIFPVHHLRLGLFQWFVGAVARMKITVNAAGGGRAALAGVSAVSVVGGVPAAAASAAFFGVQNTPHHTVSSMLLFHLFVQKINVAAHALQQLGGSLLRWW